MAANRLSGVLRGSDAAAMLQAAQLNEEELLLVSDLVKQLAATASLPQHQHAAGLAAQLEQLMPGLSMQAPAAAAAHPTQEAMALVSPCSSKSPSFSAHSSPVSSALKQPGPIKAPSAAAAAAAPTGSRHSLLLSASGSPRTPQASPAPPLLLQPSASVQHAAPASSQRSAGSASAGRPDAGTQAAAEVLSAALADPDASVEDIVGLFDCMLSVSQDEARTLQDMLLGQPTQHEEQEARSSVALQQRRGSFCEEAQRYIQQHQLDLLQLPAAPPRVQVPAPPSTAWQQQWQQRAQQQRAAETGPDRGTQRDARQQQHQQQQQQQHHHVAVRSPSVPGSILHQQQPQPLTEFSCRSRQLVSPALRSRSPTASSLRKTIHAAELTAAAEDRARSRSRSCSPLDVQREWAGSLRSASPTAAGASPGRRRRSSSPTPQGAAPQLRASWAHACWPGDQGQDRSRNPPPWDGSTRVPRRETDTEECAGPAGSPGPQRWQQQHDQQHSPAGAKQLRLPANELEERARRFFNRNVDWQRRCGLVYEQQRAAEAAGETEGCTFAPAINARSARLAAEAGGKYPMRPIRPLTPLESDINKQQAQQAQQQRRAASTGHIRPQHKGAASKGSSARHRPQHAAAVPAAVQRLFQDAAVREQRAQQAKEVTRQAERLARSWSAPRRPGSEGVSCRLYDHLQPDRATSHSTHGAAAAALLDGCTFTPLTNSRTSGGTPRRQSPPTATAASVRPGTAPSTAQPRWQQDEGQEDHEAVMATFDALLVRQPEEEQQPCMSDELQPERSHWQVNAPASPTPRSGQQQQHHHQQQRIGSLACNDDLDWGEFISRQEAFLAAKQAKLTARGARAASARSPSPQLSPGSKRILAERRALLASGSGSASGSPSGGQASTFLGRVREQCSSNGSAGKSGSGSRQAQRRLPEGCTFRPQITPRAAARQPRPLVEMSEGDRLRREAKLEQARVVADARSLDRYTFAPDLSPSRQRASSEYASVRPRLRMTDAGLAAYFASLEEKRRLLAAQQAAAERRRAEEELRECSFRPTTRPAPVFITALRNKLRAADGAASSADEGGADVQHQQQALEQQNQEEQEVQQKEQRRQRQPVVPAQAAAMAVEAAADASKAAAALLAMAAAAAAAAGSGSGSGSKHNKPAGLMLAATKKY